MTSLIAACGSGRSTSVIPAVPAASSVTTIAFIPNLRYRLLASCIVANPATTARDERDHPSMQRARHRIKRQAGGAPVDVARDGRSRPRATLLHVEGRGPAAPTLGPGGRTHIGGVGCSCQRLRPDRPGVLGHEAGALVEPEG